MSLSRLALRLAAIEALCPSARAAAGPYPTAAGAEIYDSAITPLSDVSTTAYADYVASVAGKPIVTVYTEEQETDPVEGSTYPADVELVHLVLEIFVAARGAVTVSNADGTTSEIGAVETPITSTQHEAMLDLIEAQARALLDPDSPLCPEPYVRVARELHHVKSAPMRDAVDRLSRLAARTVTFKLRIAHGALRGETTAGVGADIALLPQPLLTVAQALDPASASGRLVRQIAAGLAAAAAPTSLADIRLYANVNRNVTPTAANAEVVGDAPL